MGFIRIVSLFRSINTHSNVACIFCTCLLSFLQIIWPRRVACRNRSLASRSIAGRLDFSKRNGLVHFLFLLFLLSFKLLQSFLLCLCFKSSFFLLLLSFQLLESFLLSFGFKTGLFFFLSFELGKSSFFSLSSNTRLLLFFLPLDLL